MRSRRSRAPCCRHAHRLQRSLRGEYGPVDRERMNRRMHSCAMALAVADGRSIRAVHGTDKLLKRLTLSGPAVLAIMTLWSHDHMRGEQRATRLPRACMCCGQLGEGVRAAAPKSLMSATMLQSAEAHPAPQLTWRLSDACPLRAAALEPLPFATDCLIG